MGGANTINHTRDDFFITSANIGRERMLVSVVLFEVNARFKLKIQIPISSDVVHDPNSSAPRHENVSISNCFWKLEQYLRPGSSIECCPEMGRNKPCACLD
jgi:hypothetical protein